MKKALSTQTYAETVHVFRPPLTLWHHMLLRSANDNVMPWPKRLVLISIWGTAFGLITLATYGLNM